MNEPILKVIELSKVFPHPRGEVRALQEVDFEVYPGESLAVVGVSGAGKSTLLHIIGAIDHPSKGKVILEGEDLSLLSPFQLAQVRNQKIGFVFQFHHLLPEFNALENVMMPALISRMEKKQAEARAKKVLAELGLENRFYHRVGELSGGEQQRVAVARAVILEPKLLLCDEPTGNLDPEIGRKVEDLLLELNQKKGITLIVVTHNESLAKRMQKRIRLFGGKIIAREG